MYESKSASKIIQGVKGAIKPKKIEKNLWFSVVSSPEAPHTLSGHPHEILPKARKSIRLSRGPFLEKSGPHAKRLEFLGRGPQKTIKNTMNSTTFGHRMYSYTRWCRPEDFPRLPQAPPRIFLGFPWSTPEDFPRLSLVSPDDFPRLSQTSLVSPR